MSNPSSRTHLWLYIEEPDLAVPPGTDWEEVQRTRIPPRRLVPDPEQVARTVLAELQAEGWTEVDIRHQGWDAHPQVGKAWWISVEAVPPPGSVHGPYDARMFRP